MNRKIQKQLALFMALAVLVAGLVYTPKVQEGQVKAAQRGTFKNLNQAEITAAMGAGWNVGNQLEAVINGEPKEDGWQSTLITKELLAKVKEQGFTSVRIPISYLTKIGAAPSYTIDEAWLARIQEVVDWCMELDLYAIINMHGDGYNSVDGGWLLCNAPEKEQPQIKAKYEACWKQIATRFADYDEHLIFESMNEEFDGTYVGDPNKEYYANINAYNQIFVDTVRQTGSNNAKRWLLIPGWNTEPDYTAGTLNDDGTYKEYGFALPTDTHLSAEVPAGEKRIMISVHYYKPWDFCGDENKDYASRFGTDANIKRSGSLGGYGDEAYMDKSFKILHDRFVAQGYPVVIGEYGSIDKSVSDENNIKYRAYYANLVCYNSKQYGLIPVYWDNGYNGNNGFALFDRATITVTQQSIIDAIMAVYQSPTPTKYDAPVVDASTDYFKDAIYLGPVSSKKSGQMKLEWEYISYVDGYQLVIATNKKFTKNKKTFNINNYVQDTKTIKNLKKGKKYYAKIRAFTKVNKKKRYSKWSNIDYAKIKK